MSSGVTIFVIVGAVAGGLVQGLSGFAFGLIAMAFWAWSIEPQLAGPWWCSPRCSASCCRSAGVLLDIRTSVWMTLATAHKADHGEPFRSEAGLAKLVASEAGGRVIDRVMQIHGGYGITKDLPLERWYGEMRIRRVGEGPQRLIVARDLIGGASH